ncbi:MAG: DUF4126 domain-containing protein [Chloroflexota bacterium]
MFELLTGLGLAMPAGLNAYIPLLAVALADRYFGLINLAEPYDLISSPLGIVIIVVLLLVEMLADKVPLVDHANDLVHSVIRPSAGAVLVMASTDAVASINPILAMSLGLIVAGSVHTMKASVRPTVTATTGGIGNPVISAAEDGAAIGLTVIALLAPIVVSVILILLAIALVFLVRRRRHRRRTPAIAP